MPTNTISEHLVKLRKLNSSTQLDLAAAIGISKCTISKYERGTLFPTKENSIKLAEFFKLDTKYFYDEYLQAIDNFPQYLLNLHNRNISISKNKLCKLLEISKRTLCRYYYKNDIPSRNVFNKMQKYLNFIKN